MPRIVLRMLLVGRMADMAIGMLSIRALIFLVFFVHFASLRSQSSFCFTLLLALSPCFSDFLELRWNSLRPVLLHTDMGIQVVERPVCFVTTWIVAIVDPLNLLEPPTRTFLGLSR
jgi:hypothetical protein